MKKHTICLEARPFAAFSDEQLNRLTARMWRFWTAGTALWTIPPSWPASRARTS